MFNVGTPGFDWLLSTDPLCPNDCLANIPPVNPKADANKFFLCESSTFPVNTVIFYLS